VVKISTDDDAGDVNGDKETEDFDPRNRERHLRNAYRVLLTRARQGMIIFIPEGENDVFLKERMMKNQICGKEIMMRHILFFVMKLEFRN
jgi:DUF2075 family protein